jgi:hypothetical protein
VPRSPKSLYFRLCSTPVRHIEPGSLLKDLMKLILWSSTYSGLCGFAINVNLLNWVFRKILLLQKERQKKTPLNMLIIEGMLCSKPP